MVSQAVGIAAEVEDHVAVKEPVEQCDGDCGVAEDFSP